jgi:hypothetical protein
LTVETIIVNCNAGGTLLRCVSAALKSNVPTTETVIDNACSDGAKGQELVAE